MCLDAAGTRSWLAERGCAQLCALQRARWSEVGRLAVPCRAGPCCVRLRCACAAMQNALERDALAQPRPTDTPLLMCAPCVVIIEALRCGCCLPQWCAQVDLLPCDCKDV
eukprot:366232-Chlamydomonas_euryale.AAC.15